LADMAANEPYSFKSVHDVCDMLGNLELVEGRKAKRLKKEGSSKSE
jgi:hypothetical protein